MDQSKGAQKDPMADTQPTSQQIFTMATELRRMMKSEAFEYAVKLMRKDYQNRFFTSKPEDKFAREQAYQRNAALDDLLSAMETIIYVSEYNPEE